MPFLKFADNAAMYDSTPLDNMFIIENLPSAPDVFLKVYIYARMLCMHPEMGGIEELTRALKVDEDAVQNAFAYWERMGFMRRVADNPPEYVFIPARGGTVSEMDRDYYKYRDFNGELQGLFKGKLMHPAQYGLAQDWLNVYGFEQGAVIALVKNAVARSNSQNPDPASIFKAVHKRIKDLANRNITDEAGVTEEIVRDESVETCVKDVMKNLGMFRKPTEAERELAAKWMNEWKLSSEEIIKGCRETVKAHNPSFGYLDSILANKIGNAENAGFDEMKSIFKSMGLNINPSAEHKAWYRGLISDGFERETIELAARQQSRRKLPSINGLMDMLDTWRTNGLYKFAAASDFVKNGERLRDEFKEILTKAGIVQGINENDLAAYEAWRQIMPTELIQLAADNSKGRSYPLTRMYSLLEKWHNAGITDLTAARNELSGNSQPRQAKITQNPALNYEQRDYSNDDFAGDDIMEEVRRILEQQNAESGGN